MQGLADFRVQLQGPPHMVRGIQKQLRLAGVPVFITRTKPEFTVRLEPSSEEYFEVEGSGDRAPGVTERLRQVTRYPTRTSLKGQPNHLTLRFPLRDPFEQILIEQFAYEVIRDMAQKEVDG